MPQTFSVTLPDDACEYLRANARWNETTPQELLNQWANQVIQLRSVGLSEAWARLYAEGKIPSQCDLPMKSPLTEEELSNDAFLKLAGSFAAESPTSEEDHNLAFASVKTQIDPPTVKHA